MRYLALCCDYDGTIAQHGRVDRATFAALERVVASGRHLVLVTGRQLDDLARVLPRLDLFERIVAENGALLYTPATREEQRLADPPSPALVEALRARAVQPLAVGRCIVATWEPHDATVLEAIRELGLELQVTFNKGAVMVLPSGVNKATGLQAALASLGLSAHNAVAIGDAENDHAFLAQCEFAAAVANALPALKDRADLVTRADHGAGVAELIDELLEDDLARHAGRLARHRIALAVAPDGRELQLEPYGSSLLVAGSSGGGKSTVAIGLVERIAARGYSFVVIDPEGDYDGLAGAVTLGSSAAAPSLDEAMQLIARHDNAVLNLVGLPLADRPELFRELLPRIEAERAGRGRPHWIVIDEAHHLLPAAAQALAAQALPERLGNAVLITVHPELIVPRALAGVDAVVAVGAEPGRALRQFAEAAECPLPPPAGAPAPLDPGEGLVWVRAATPAPVRARLIPGRDEHRRHTRKYAEGELPEDRSFWFRGPENRLNLRAQNLILFLQIADGIDDATWEHHRRRGDYSRWIGKDIKDEALAHEAARIEGDSRLDAQGSRAALREAIERSYTLPG